MLMLNVDIDDRFWEGRRRRRRIPKAVPRAAADFVRQLKSSYLWHQSLIILYPDLFKIYGFIWDSTSISGGSKNHNQQEISLSWAYTINDQFCNGHVYYLCQMFQGTRNSINQRTLLLSTRVRGGFKLCFG